MFLELELLGTLFSSDLLALTTAVPAVLENERNLNVPAPMTELTSATHQIEAH